jgi:hypothetical protein
MFDGVGRRRDQSDKQLVNIGAHSLNGNERDCLFRNNGDGSFTDVGYVNAADRKEDGRGLSIIDYDTDGRLDVVLRNYKQPAQLLHNVGGDGHWIEIKLVGTKSNRDAVGARITLRAGGAVQTREVHAGAGYLSGSSLIQHFGLDTQKRVDSVEIRWPSGTTTRADNLAVDRVVTLREDEASTGR